LIINLFSNSEKLLNTLLFCRGVKTFKFKSDLDDQDNIPFERIRRYATFAKLIEKNKNVLFVKPENEENFDSDISYKVESF
jgi:hypothetical protein